MSATADRWHLLRDYAEATLTCMSVKELAEQTLGTALTALNASSASVSRFELERGRVKILHNLGQLTEWEDMWPQDSYYLLSEYSQLMTTVGGSERSWRGSLDDPATAGPDRDLLVRIGKRHAASFRVRVADSVWGDIYLAREDGPQFDDTDLAVGEVLVGLMSAGLSAPRAAGRPLSPGLHRSSDRRRKPTSCRRVARTQARHASCLRSGVSGALRHQRLEEDQRLVRPHCG